MYYTIVAPSGAGKTTFISKTTPRGVVLVDADDTKLVSKVYTDLRAEFGDKWWLDDAKLKVKDERFAAVRTSWDRSLSGASNIVVFTAEVELVLPEARKTSVFAVPYLSMLEANMGERAKDPGDHPVLSGAELVANKLYYEEYARKRQIPVVRSIDVAFHQILERIRNATLRYTDTM